MINMEGQVTMEPASAGIAGLSAFDVKPAGFKSVGV